MLGCAVLGVVLGAVVAVTTGVVMTVVVVVVVGAAAQTLVRAKAEAERRMKATLAANPRGLGLWLRRPALQVNLQRANVKQRRIRLGGGCKEKPVQVVRERPRLSHQRRQFL